MWKAVHKALFPSTHNNYRAGILRFEGILLIVFATIIFQSALTIGETKGVLGYAAQISPSEVIRLTNQKRVENGLNALEYNEALTVAAERKGKYMLEHDFWAHVAPDGTEPWYFFTTEGYNYKYAGENLARDFTNPKDAVEAWMASPSHRENMLSDKYRDIGIAVVEGDLAGKDATIIVQLFGTKAGDTIPVVPVASADTEEPENSLSLNIPEVQAQAQETKKSSDTAPLLNISPFNTTKTVSIAIIAFMVILLAIDIFIIESKGIKRTGGRAFAHISFFGILFVIFLIARAGEII